MDAAELNEEVRDGRNEGYHEQKRKAAIEVIQDVGSHLQGLYG